MDVKRRCLIFCTVSFLVGCGQSSGPHRPLAGGPVSTPKNGGQGITYATVQPVFQQRCSACHNFASNFEAIHNLAKDGKNSLVYKYIIEKSPREMPPPDSAQSHAITPQERQLIGQWSLAGAPGGKAGASADTTTSAPQNDQSAAVKVAGQAIMDSQKCQECHNKNSGLNAPTILGQNQYYLADQLTAFKNGQRKSSTMEPVAKSLSDEEIQILSQWLSSQQEN
jgi:cytochrome c553